MEKIRAKIMSDGTGWQRVRFMNNIDVLSLGHLLYTKFRNICRVTKARQGRWVEIEITIKEVKK